MVLGPALHPLPSACRLCAVQVTVVTAAMVVMLVMEVTAHLTLQAASLAPHPP